MAKELSMEAFLSGLNDLLAKGFETQSVHSYLEGTLITADSLKPYVNLRRDHYTRNLVHKNKAFELLVICWEVGQKAPIHGHEGERCWSRVEKGRLRFTN